MEAMHGAVVTLDYTLTLDDGEVIGQEQGVEYLHGHHNIMPGLEKGLEGIRAGEQRTVTLEPAEAYGEHDPGRLITAPIAEVPDADKLAPGMRISASTIRGPVELAVVEVREDAVVFDANHPLAGKRIHFDCRSHRRPPRPAARAVPRTSRPRGVQHLHLRVIAAARSRRPVTSALEGLAPRTGAVPYRLPVVCSTVWERRAALSSFAACCC